MCGIFGLWNRQGEPLDLEALRLGVASLRHRGPDDEGYLLVNTRTGAAIPCAGDDTDAALELPSLQQYAGGDFDLALGFRRLSILDLSSAGHQPMSSHDGRYWTVFNGEIYNYLELKDELQRHGYTFRTNTDTEVVLGAYDRWGAECLARFNGMWALAIWDNLKRSLFLARDRVGVKPCYLAEGPRCAVTFASEIKALRASGARCEPLPSAVGGFASLGVFPSHCGGATFFRDIRSLPPGHACVVGKRSETLRAYWRIPEAEPRPMSDTDVLHGFESLLLDSVRLRLRADVPLGTCLSGGLDSSVIVALVRELMHLPGAPPPESVGPRQHTFSAVYDNDGEWNERIHVDRVLARTQAQGHFVVPTGNGLWSEIQEVLAYQDEPVQSSAIFAQWCVMRLAKQHGVTVLLDGQGADELLGGYRPYRSVVRDLLRSGRGIAAWRAARDIQRNAGLARLTLLSSAAGQVLRPPVRWCLGHLGVRFGRGWATQMLAESGLNVACIAETAADVSRAAADATKVQHASLDAQLRYQTVEESLPNLLRYEDRNSMAFSIEARVPFLDYRLIEFAFRHAANARFRQGWTKWPLRRIAAARLPEEIAWRRDKVGYDVPEIHWLRARRPELIAVLAETGPFEEFFHVPAVCRRATELLDRGAKPDGRQIWRWLNTALWLRSLAASPPFGPGTIRRAQREHVACGGAENHARPIGLPCRAETATPVRARQLGSDSTESPF